MTIQRKIQLPPQHAEQTLCWVKTDSYVTNRHMDVEPVTTLAELDAKQMDSLGVTCLATARAVIKRDEDRINDLQAETERLAAERDMAISCTLANTAELHRADATIGELKADNERLAKELAEAKGFLDVAEGQRDEYREALKNAAPGDDEPFMGVVEGVPMYGIVSCHGPLQWRQEGEGVEVWWATYDEDSQHYEPHCTLGSFISGNEEWDLAEVDELRARIASLESQLAEAERTKAEHQRLAEGWVELAEADRDLLSARLAKCETVVEAARETRLAYNRNDIRGLTGVAVHWLSEIRDRVAAIDALPPPPGSKAVTELDYCNVFHTETAHSGPGWYYVDAEYQDEGSVGAFKTRDEAVAHAKAAGYEERKADSTVAMSRDEALMVVDAYLRGKPNLSRSERQLCYDVRGALGVRAELPEVLQPATTPSEADAGPSERFALPWEDMGSQLFDARHRFLADTPSASVAAFIATLANADPSAAIEAAKREVAEAVLKALPRCNLCPKPARWENRRGDSLYCEEHCSKSDYGVWWLNALDLCNRILSSGGVEG